MQLLIQSLIVIADCVWKFDPCYISYVLSILGKRELYALGQIFFIS